MTDRRYTSALLVLLRRKLVPATQLAEAAESSGDPEALLRELTPADLLSNVDEALERELAVAARDLDEWQKGGIDVLSVFDPGYPLNLRTVHDRPALLYVQGQLDERDASSVAVVGTRRPTEAGLARARKLAAQLAESGHVVVSGLAAGIDTAAHQSALAAGGRTVAVIGTGHDHTFPKENAALQERLAAESAVLSQFTPEQGPRPWTFPLRNAVMSGVALATVVVEAGQTSGARMQARLALEHGRPVFLLQSLVDEHEWAQEHARRPGVYVVVSTEEVVERLASLYPSELVVAS